MSVVDKLAALKKEGLDEAAHLMLQERALRIKADELMRKREQVQLALSIHPDEVSNRANSIEDELTMTVHTSVGPNEDA